MIIYFNLFTNCSSSRPTEFQLGHTNELQFLTNVSIVEIVM